MPKRHGDFYSLLGVPRSSTPDEIRHAYHKAAKRLHPDTNLGPGETEMFMDVNQAYQVLSDPQLRAAYDAGLPPEIAVEEYLKSRVQLSRQSLSPLSQSQIVYALMDFSPSDAYMADSGSIPLNLCLVVDCSTSMKGEKLEKVKATAVQLIRKLKPQDIFSMVTFNDRAEVIIPATRQAIPLKMENRVQSMETSGGTEIFQGLNTGFNEVKQYLNPTYINHIILLTDGHTYGDEQACYDLAKEAAKIGIGITAMGIGNDWKDQFLDLLARLTGGYCMLVAHPRDIERLLNEKFVYLTNVFAENVILDYQIGKGVKLKSAFRLQPETSPLNCENPLRMGQILNSKSLSVLLEFLIEPMDDNIQQLAVIDGNLQVTISGLQGQVPSLPIHVSLPVSKDLESRDAPPATIVKALSRLLFYNMQEKARKELDAGNYKKATEYLQRLAANLLAQGERSLANTIMLEIKNIETDKAFSEEGIKQIKYGTRALLLPEEHKP